MFFKKALVFSIGTIMLLGCTESVDDSNGERVTKIPDINITIANNNTNNINSTDTDNITFIDNTTLTATASATACAISTCSSTCSSS